MSSCSVCPRTAPAGHHACPLCAAEVRAWLAELPYQGRLLAALLAPTAAPAQGRIGGTGRAHSPAPVDLRVLALLGPGHIDPVDDPDGNDTTVPIHTLLTGWAGHIAYTYPAVHRDQWGTAHTQPCEQAWASGGATTTGICAWLTAYLPYAVTLPTIADLHRQLGNLIHRVRDLTGVEPREHPQRAPCPRCEAFALVRTDGQPRIQCRACGHRISPETHAQHTARFLKTHQTRAPA